MAQLQLCSLMAVALGVVGMRQRHQRSMDVLSAPWTSVGGNYYAADPVTGCISGVEPPRSVIEGWCVARFNRTTYMTVVADDIGSRMITIDGQVYSTEDKVASRYMGKKFWYYSWGEARKWKFCFGPGPTP